MPLTELHTQGLYKARTLARILRSEIIIWTSFPMFVFA